MQAYYLTLWGVGHNPLDSTLMLSTTLEHVPIKQVQPTIVYFSLSYSWFKLIFILPLHLKLEWNVIQFVQLVQSNYSLKFLVKSQEILFWHFFSAESVDKRHQGLSYKNLQNERKSCDNFYFTFKFEVRM
jgi:hypothetical protein